MYNTIIFDLDGTLLDTLTDLEECLNHTLKNYNLKCLTKDEVRGFLGNGMEKLVELAVPNGLNNPLFNEIYASFKEYYFQNSTKHTLPYNEVIELLKALKEKNYKLGIVSNKADSAVKDLCKTFFSDFINVAIGEKETTRRKPYPDAIFEAIKLLNADISHCLFVGDSEVDILTAKNASVDCISCSWGFRSAESLKENNAKIIISHPLELLEYLK